MIIQKKGTISSDVVWIKQMLEAAGLYKVESPNEFGILCDLSIREFQKIKKLKVDGQVGDKTREELRKYEIKPSSPISPLKTEFLSFIRPQNGYGIYLWGAQGQIYGAIDTRVKPLTESLIKQCESGKYETDALKLFKKRIADGKVPFRAYDCSGLIIFWLLIEKGLIKRDYNANGIYETLCKKIPIKEREVGDLLFRYDSNKRIAHVGVYSDFNKVTHAKGRSFGVVTETFDSSWDLCGRLYCLE